MKKVNNIEDLIIIEEIWSTISSIQKMIVEAHSHLYMDTNISEKYSNKMLNNIELLKMQWLNIVELDNKGHVFPNNKS